MNAHNQNFSDNLEEAARRISLSLRFQSGIDADTHIISDPEKTAMVFVTDDTDTKTLRHFLSSEMNEAASQGCWKKACPVEIKDFPGTNRRGAVAVTLSPQLVSCLVAKL